MTPSASRVSFIIPVRNDVTRLRVCLDAIRSNGGSDGSVEIVVVDNGSSDGSAELARTRGANVIVMERAAVSELRNSAAGVASGNVLAFVDADNEIVPGWLQAALETLGDSGVGATGAPYRAPHGGTWVQRTCDDLRRRGEGRQDVDWLASGNLAVWRETFRAVGGFDTSLEACEDVDLCNRIRASGFRIVSDDRLVSVHHGDPRTLRDLFRGELWRGRDNLRVSLRRPISWRQVVSAGIAVVDLAMIGLGAAGLMAMVRFPLAGLAMLAAAVLVVSGLALARTIRALKGAGAVTASTVLQTFVVMCVYDTARALAPVVRARHRSKRAVKAA